MKKRILSMFAAGALGALLLAPVANATIVSTSGAIVKIAPPASTLSPALESDTQAFAWDERHGVTLAAPLAVDISTPGLYDDNDDLTPSTIAAGSAVNSQFVHADNVGSGGGAHTIEGTVVTDTDILGIMIMNPALDNSDFLGAPGTIYPTGFDQRQFTIEAEDFLIEQVDKRTVFLHFEVTAHVDQVRIITEAEPEEPPRGAEGCTPGYWKQPHHFDSWVGFAPGDSFEAVFARDAFSGSPTLLQVLSTGGGGMQALGRHSAAALLNSAHPDVDFAFTTAEVISMFQAAFDAGGTAIEATKNLLDRANNGGCGLN